MTLEASVVDPAASETTPHDIAEQGRPGMIIRLYSLPAGTPANGYNTKPIRKISRRISAAKAYRILVDVNLRCHAGDVSISPNFIVIHTKHNFVTLDSLYNRIIYFQSNFE